MKNLEYSLRLLLLAMAFGGLLCVLVAPVVAGTWSNDYLEYINQGNTNSYVGHRATITGYDWEITSYSCIQKYDMCHYDELDSEFIEQNTLGYSNFVRTHSSFHVTIWIYDFLWWGHYEYYHYDIYTDAYMFDNNDHYFAEYFDVEEI